MATKSTRDRRPRSASGATSPGWFGEQSGGTPTPVAVGIGPRTIVRQIHACAGQCHADDVRAVLHALERSARRGAATTRRAAALEAAVAAAVDAAAGAGADRWLAAEAAAWGLGRLLRPRRRRTGTAGRLMERLVAEARAGSAGFADRDTRAARFVVVLARLFAAVEACRELEAPAAAAVGEEIGRLVTADGAVVLPGSTAVVERVARWAGVRSAATLMAADPPWDDAVDRLLKAAATASLRLLGDRARGLDADGRLPAVATSSIVALLGSTGSGPTGRTVRALRRGAAAARERRLLPTDLHDTAAATAVIRTGWDRGAVRVLLDYRAAIPHLEIAVADRLLVAGPWEWSATADGRRLDAEGAWTVSGWESDRKSAFLEISAPLGSGLRLDRQVVVLRRQGIVLLADALVPVAAPNGSAAAPDLVHRVAVPLAAGLEAEPAAETREVLVYDGGMRFMALPLALPEWRTAGGGSFAVAGGGLVLEQSGAKRLYAPLWLDCDPRRIGRPLTWRQLTVADTRRNLPPHQAAGFRVQAGLEQWLLYQALDMPRNRTLLGCNVSAGFLLGRIKRSGGVARTVEIE